MSESASRFSECQLPPGILNPASRQASAAGPQSIAEVCTTSGANQHRSFLGIVDRCALALRLCGTVTWQDTELDCTEAITLGWWWQS